MKFIAECQAWGTDTMNQCIGSYMMDLCLVKSKRKWKIVAEFFFVLPAHKNQHRDLVLIMKAQS